MGISTALNGYSLAQEAHRIFSLVFDHSVELNIPVEAIKLKDKVSFDSTHDQIYYPIPLKVTETLAALKGVEGAVAAALADIRFGPSQERKISVNLEKATSFGFQALIAKIDNMSRECPEVKAKLKDTDIHAAQSNLYRRLAANLYRTKSENEFFHPHGSLNPTSALNMIGLDGQRCDLHDYEEIIQLIECHVQRYTAEELEEINRDRGQAGVTAYRHEDFVQSPHGATISRQPWWTVTPIGEDLPPTPFPTSESSRILEGIKVLELSCVIAGPNIGRILAEYGAEVVRITGPKTPDVPFFQIDGNMGKRTADLDLKTEEGRERFTALLADADIFIDGYRKGVTERLGYGPSVLASVAKSRGKGIVYVDETCFGHVGEWAGRPGWQQVADCVTGLAWVQGEFMGRGTPIVSPLPIADHGAGCMGAVTALIGLHHRAQQGGSYHGKVSLVQFNLLLLGLGIYPDYIQAALRDSLPSDFFELRYCDNVERSSRIALSIIQAKFQNRSHALGNFTMDLIEKWYSHGYQAEIEVMKPVVEIEQVDSSFMRASRPNGTDEPCWSGDGALNLDYRLT